MSDPRDVGDHRGLGDPDVAARVADLEDAVADNTKQLRPPRSFVRGVVQALGALFGTGVLAGLIGGILKALGVDIGI